MSTYPTAAVVRPLLISVGMLRTPKFLSLIIFVASCATIDFDEVPLSADDHLNASGEPAIGEFHGIIGLEYVTESQSGTTGGITEGTGQFRYLEGETVEFFVGDVSLGRAVAKPHMTAFDLAGVAKPPVGVQEISKSVKSPQFRHAVNLAVFLTSFDYNGDSTDGVIISKQVHDQFRGETLDFTMPFYMFRNGPFTRAFIDAQRSFKGGKPHNVVSVPRATQILYAASNIDAKLYAPTSSKATASTSQSSSESLTRWTYNPWGDITNKVTTRVPDNGSSTTEALQIDANGNVQKRDYSRVVPVKAPTSYSNTFTYDIHNNLIGMTAQAGGLKRTNVYDARGLLVSVQTEQGTPGQISRTSYQYRYNGKNELVETKESGSVFGSGPYSRTETRRYDERHNVLQMQVVDSRFATTLTVNRTYDEKNNLVGSESYEGNQRVLRLVISYDENSNPTTLQRTDTRGTFTTRFVYDQKGNLVRQEGPPLSKGPNVVHFGYDGNNALIRTVTSYSGQMLTADYSVAPVGWGIFGPNLTINSRIPNSDPFQSASIPANGVSLH